MRKAIKLCHVVEGRERCVVVMVEPENVFGRLDIRVDAVKEPRRFVLELNKLRVSGAAARRNFWPRCPALPGCRRLLCGDSVLPGAGRRANWP